MKRFVPGFGFVLVFAALAALGGIGETFGMMTKREEINVLDHAMKQERSRYEPFYREVDRNIVPGSYRGQLSDTGRGERLDDAILDSTPTRAHETLEAGFTAHVTPPGKIWHHFKIANDPELAEYGPVARWLDDVTRIQFATYEQAGMYESLQPFYGYMGSFGSAALWTEERVGRGIHFRNLPVGSWWTSLDEWGMPHIFRRELRLTVDQTVRRFGRPTKSGSPDWSNFSNRVRTDYDGKGRLNPVDIGHMVYPNPDYRPDYLDARNKRFLSCYYELGDSAMQERGQDGQGLFLRESGYDLFPALYAPWDLIGEDVYGYRCPGRTVLGDVKQLYDDVETSGLAIAQLARPTTMGTQAAVDAANRTGYLPGRMIPMSAQDLQAGGLKPIHDKDPRIAEIENRITGLRNRVDDGYHVGTFRMLDKLQDRERTAYEFSIRQEERLVQLVGVLNRLNRRGLFPIAERTFNYNFSQGKLPQMPDELVGQDLEIEIVSSMAQAMRAMGLGAIDRVLLTVGQIAVYNPQIVDKVDLDQVVDEVAKGVGAPARIIVDDATVAKIRAARAQAQQAQQASLEAAEAAKTVKTLAEAKTGEEGGRNALVDVLRTLKGGQA